MVPNERIVIVDFGGQYAQLIARRVRECGVYSEIVSYRQGADAIIDKAPKGIIFTGGPASVYAEDAPQIETKLFHAGIPIFGICYGMQLMCRALGGIVTASEQREYGHAEVVKREAGDIFAHVGAVTRVWMSHGDYVTEVPEGFAVIGSTQHTPVAAIADTYRKLYGVQFHPEVAHTDEGQTMLRSFLLDVCGCSGSWTMEHYATQAIEEIRARVGNGKVLLALSGGVDSSVCAKLISAAVGSQLTCIFVDHGLMRLNEGDEVEAAFKDSGVNFIRVNAEQRFLEKLAGVTDPERKRKIIGEEFIRIFEEEGRKIGKVDYLAQGTIYPDVVESGEGNAAVIKSHHNVGGLPAVVDFKGLIEPLRDLFKDEVRALGEELGLADYLVWRQPFPGPGLAIRVIGEVTKAKLDTLRQADAIWREEIKNAGWERKVNQYFAVLTANQSVGVMGDSRTYAYTLALRGVVTNDFMTAEWAKIPYEVLATASNRIVNEVAGINRVVYDITGKPPATIEWE